MARQSMAIRETTANYGRGFPDPKGSLRLTVDSIQFRPKGFDESSNRAPLEIQLADIRQAAPGVRTHSYPLWMHIILFPLPLLLTLTLRPLIRLLAPKRWLSISTANGRYFFWVDDMAAWMEAINDQREAREHSTVAQAAPQQERSAPEAPVDERLRQLKKLLEDGLISDEEFQAKKGELLKQL